MRHALDAAARLGYTVRREPPRLDQAATWTDLYITNANVLCLPVHDLRDPPTGNLLFSSSEDDNARQSSAFGGVDAIRATMIDDMYRPSPQWCEQLLLR
mmetsp:Transcript_7307/g.22500  ORF Transcript_7307/g.22500 Transcript_7307/m.22500 type:complete len:99 (-) Transcript_7307:50-346(-)